MKVCPKCNVNKEDKEFYRNAAKRDRLDSCCKTCRNHLYNYNTKKFTSMKKAAKGFDMELITQVAEELGMPLDKVKEIIVSQSRATKHAMNGGFSVKWMYVGTFRNKVRKIFTFKKKNKDG